MKLKTKLHSLAVLVGAVAAAQPALAAEGEVPGGIPRLDHVFVIMMENHGYSQIIGNPDAPFINYYAHRVNSATNYFAVAHPSLTNYLEIVGGSNFGVLNDNSPDWHNTNCQNNLSSGMPGFDVSSTPAVCPIFGIGTDAATPILDTSNETSPPSITAVTEIDGKLSYPAASNTVGKTIADQLDAVGRSWKSYQESLSPGGADGINYADGFYSNTSNLATLLAGSGATQSNIVKLYAVKHNPFVYFRSVQEHGLRHITGFDGHSGLFDDLKSGDVPAFSLISPNQCHDQHGQNNATAACFEDPNDNGTLVGLNPGLIRQGDEMLRSLVQAIHDSPVWTHGHNAIVIVWDENDYSAAPNPNRVLLTVDNSSGEHAVQSGRFYTHFSLLKSIESGLHLPCLNHACDPSVAVMSDLF
jgi:hypothetical protein